MTYGVSAAFDRVGNDIVVQVDSGALELVGDSTRTRVAAGSSVRVDAAAIVTALSAAERDAAFAWRTGRLALTRASGQRIVEEVNQWFGLAVRFTPALTAAESLSVNVPLSTVDSLSAALGAAVGGTVERDGQQLTVNAAPPPPVVPTANKLRSKSRSRAERRRRRRPFAGVTPRYPLF
jgi:ferric-dicitrate binding protein FerR (iron transport regulator)